MTCNAMLMKKPAMLGMLAVLALNLIALSSASAQSRSPAKAEWLDDPVFGISIDMNRAHYERLSPTTTAACQTFPRGRFWVFASYVVDDREYLLVNGFVRGADSDPIGNLILLRGSRCSGEAADWLAATVIPAQGYAGDTTTYELPGQGASSTCNDQGDCRYTLRSRKEEDVVRGLARDAIVRGRRALGEQAFRGKACARSTRDSNARSSQIFSEELEAYCAHE